MSTRARCPFLIRWLLLAAILPCAALAQQSPAEHGASAPPPTTAGARSSAAPADDPEPAVDTSRDDATLEGGARPDASSPQPDASSPEPAASSPRSAPSSSRPAGDNESLARAGHEHEKSPGDHDRAAGRGAASRAGGKPQDHLELGTTDITGNRELPKVMYIVPWKRSDLGDLTGKPLNSLIDQTLEPVDRDVFRRQNRYYGAVTAPNDVSPSGASASGALASGAAASGAAPPPAAGSAPR